MTEESESDAALLEVVHAVAARWDEFAAFFADRWPDIVERIAVIVNELRAHPRTARRAALVYELGRLFQGHPSIARVLIISSTPTRGDELPGSGGLIGQQNWGKTLAELGARLDGILAERHTEVFAPSSLTVGGRDVVAVRLTRTELATRIASTVVLAEQDAVFRILIHASDDRIRIDKPHECTIAVAPDDDGETAVFRITGVRTGEAALTLDIVHRDVVLATLRVSVMIGEFPANRTALVATAHVGTGGPRPADIELRIHLDGNGDHPVLRFVVHSPDGRAGFHHFPAGETALQDSPHDYQQRLLRELERTHGPGSARRQSALGEKLWRDLVPERFRNIYRELGDARTMQITSDEPWIPWELVRPYEQEAGRTVLDEEPWCLRFDLTRWLAGKLGIPGHVQVASMAFMKVGLLDGEQASAALTTESQRLRRLLAGVGVEDLSPSRVDGAQVNRLLDQAAGHLGLWHFCGHGDARGLLLADGTRLRHDDIAGHREADLCRRRPLVVLNVCRSAQQEWGPGGLAGWAETFVRRCGAVFVGTLWAVTDDVAAHLATELYDHLHRGHSIGPALTAARHACREKWPDDPSWLAYSAYAHPHTTVTLGT